MANKEQYTIPLAIDPKLVLAGLDQTIEKLDVVITESKKANASISDSFASGAKATQDFAVKMDAGAKAAKKVSDAAKAAGVDIDKAFSGDNIKTAGIAEKVTEFIGKMKTAAGKPVDFKFNIDQAGVKLLVDKLTQAKTETQAFSLILASAKERLSGLAVGSSAFEALNAQIQTAEAFVNELKGDVSGLKQELTEPIPGDGLQPVSDGAEEATKKFIPLRLQLKQMKVELQEMEQAGRGGSQEFIELSKRAGEVSDQIQDTSQRIKNLASDTKGIDAGITAIRGLAGAFAVGQGALALFGDQNEEVAKTIAKVQGAMALLQGVQEVANVLNKDSALMVYLKTFAMKADTTATVVHTVALEAETVATAEATVATNTFTAALLANPIILIAAAFVAATYAVAKFAGVQSDAKVAAQQYAESLEREARAMQLITRLNDERQTREEANAQADRKRASESIALGIKVTEQQLFAGQQQVAELEKKRKELQDSDTFFDGEEKKRIVEIGKKITELTDQNEANENKILVAEIKLKKQLQDEELKSQLDFIHEKAAQQQAELSLLNEAKTYTNEIGQLRLNELQASQYKEVELIKLTTAQKIKSLADDNKLNIAKLETTRKEIKLDLDLKEQNKALYDQKIADINRQIALEQKAGVDRLRLEKEIATESNVQIQLVNKKYAEQDRDIKFQVATTLLQLEKQTAAQRVDLIELTAKHDIDVVERSSQTVIQKKEQIEAIKQKMDKDSRDASLDQFLKEIDLQKTVNETQLMQSKAFFDKSRDAQALHNLLLAQNELEAAEAKLAALKTSGKNESDQEVKNLQNTVARMKGEMAALKKDVKPQSLAEILFPDDDKGQRRFNLFISTLGETGKAVDAYTSLLVANYQKQIEAQKKVVSGDDDALSKLNSQLQAEQDLKKKGYANNVDGIQKEIAAKNKQRDEDVRKQEEYQKKMEAVQKKALLLQAAIQAANLITASTKIFLASSDLGPIGVGLSIASIAAMLAAFVATQAQAFGAVEASSTKMAKGGMVKGKSHAQGGQKFYAPDGGAGIVELEADEFVTSKRQTEKYLPLLQVINDDRLKSMDDRALVNMLGALGVHFQTDNQHKEALLESREYASHQIQQINVINAGQQTPAELVSIDENLKLMLAKSHGTTTVTEEDGFIVTRKGNYTKRVKK